MSAEFTAELLQALVAATKPSQVEAILRSLGDNPSVSVDTPFSQAGFHWRFYGNTESNMSTINLASKAGRSLVERVTNAFDAVIEKRILSAPSLPSSPMDAAKTFFGRPPTTAEDGLFAWKEYQTAGYDRLVQVVLADGDREPAPTVDILDDGIGIEPDAFATSVLSLQRGNKIKKPYLAGAWGQGGSSTLGFSDYVVVVSRPVSNPRVVGFTVVKLLRLPYPYKEDAYVFLALNDPETGITVPHCTLGGTLEAYPTIGPEAPKPGPLITGTLVRHFGYRLGDALSSTLSASPGNLYHSLQHMLFDPMLPFRVVDLRSRRAPKNELITGSRNRLMNLRPMMASDNGLEELSDERESRTELRHHVPREMVSPREGVQPNIGLEYWVVFNRRKRQDKEGETKLALRASSNELYVDKSRPILSTLNGQNQGELPARLLTDLQLPMVAKHIVIHIDTSLAGSDVRRDLFASTREGFKEGETLTELERVLKNMLKEDDTLYAIERELVESILKRGSSNDRREVKRQITGLLRDAGLAVKDKGDVLQAGGDGPVTTAPPPPPPPPPSPQRPLPTLPYPQVSRFEIVYPLEVLSVAKQDNHSVRIETDANFQFDREGRIAIRIDPPKLEVASKGVLRDGRMKWRLRPTEDSNPGDEGTVTLTLTKPDGSQLAAELLYEVLRAREEPASRREGLVPPFEILPVSPDDDPETFHSVWDSVDQNDLTRVAYRAIEAGGQLIVYYSTAFAPLTEQLKRFKDNPSLGELFRENYEIWVAYHAIMQRQEKQSLPMPHDAQHEELDRIAEHERTVVATMQVKQALKMAEYQALALKQSAAV